MPDNATVSFRHGYSLTRCLDKPTGEKISFLSQDASPRQPPLRRHNTSANRPPSRTRPLLARISRIAVALAAASWTAFSSAAPISWNPTYFNDVGLSASDFSLFQSSISTALNFYSTTYESPNPITVNVEFHAGNTGLGTTTSYYGNFFYQDYRNALASTGASIDDATALSFLPNSTGNPVNGNPSMEAPLPLLRALGLGGHDPSVSYDASMVLNVGLMTLGRSGPPAPGTYDLIQVTYHELNEVLGWTSSLNGVPNSPIVSPTGPIQVADLFRYLVPGVRSFTSDPNEAAYFSIDGGLNSLANFNTSDGGDRQDFNGSPFPSVQDAFSSPNLQLDNGLAERTFLDVIGYNFRTAVSIDEPGSAALLLLGILAFALIRRARRDLQPRGSCALENLSLA